MSVQKKRLEVVVSNTEELQASYNSIERIAGF